MAVVRSEVGRGREGHGREPVLEDHVVAKPLEKRLEEVVVGVHEAGEHDLAAQVDGGGARTTPRLLHLVRGSHGGDAAVDHGHCAIEDNVARLVDRHDRRVC